MQLIILRRAVVFEFNAGISEFGFKPIASEVAHGRVAEADIDPGACLAPCTGKGVRAAMRHQCTAIEKHEIVIGIIRCFILLIPKIADAPGAVFNINRGLVGCARFLARGNTDEQQEI